MNWLSGKPQRVLSLHWPENDPLAPLIKSASGTWCVLDDQVLRSFTVHDPNGQSTAVYLAKLHEISGEGSTATFVNIAILPHAVHRLALLPDRVGFASLEFTKDASSVTLRIHNWDGTISKEKTAHAVAAYGDLVATRHALAVCISSGQPYPKDMYLAGSPDRYHRVDADSVPVLAPPDLTNMSGDQILVWMFESDIATSPQIPQDDEAPLFHQANFQFFSDSHIALGGVLLSSFGRPAPLLKVFHVDKPDKYSQTFTHGENLEMDNDLDVIAKPGSSGHNAVLASYHDTKTRFTVVVNGLLSGEIDPDPTIDSVGLHPFWTQPGFSRTLEGFINESLPSISDNRLLVGLEIDKNQEVFHKYVVKPAYPCHGAGEMLFLYDFDQVRCRELCNLTASERTSLESKLRKENPNAQVKVVERNFCASIEEEVDKEWSYEESPPQAWKAHLRNLYEIEESRKNGTAETPILEFDEAPNTQKANPRVLFTRSAIWLPEETNIRTIDFRDLALTASGIVHVPSPGTVGHFFCFADS